MNAYLLMDLLLSGGINYLVQKQQVDALIAKARAEQRDITTEELDTLKAARDALANQTNALLDSVS